MKNFIILNEKDLSQPWFAEALKEGKIALVEDATVLQNKVLVHDIMRVLAYVKVYYSPGNTTPSVRDLVTHLVEQADKKLLDDLNNPDRRMRGISRIVGSLIRRKTFCATKISIVHLLYRSQKDLTSLFCNEYDTESIRKYINQGEKDSALESLLLAYHLNLVENKKGNFTPKK